MKGVSRNEILVILHKLDDSLLREEVIVLCGMSAMVLQGYDTRETRDIGILRMSKMLSRVNVLNVDKHFDVGSMGVAQMLEDYEERLVAVKDDFKWLSVFVISLEDWVVSKFNSPKVDDIWLSEFVNLDLINTVERKMDKYTGLSVEKALFDIKVAKMHLSEREATIREFK